MNVLLFLVRFFSTLVSLVAVFKCAYISPYTVAVAFCSKCTWTEACVCCVSWCHAGVVASPVHRGRRGTAGLPYNCPPSQTWWAPAETPLNWPSPSDPNLRSTSSSNHRSDLIIEFRSVIQRAVYGTELMWISASKLWFYLKALVFQNNIQTLLVKSIIFLWYVLLQL